MILRRIARPMLAAVFVSGGIETLRNPKPRIQAAEPVLDKTVNQVQDRLPEQLPTDAESLVKANAAVQIGAGVALALGRFPRLSALLLAGTLVPTTVAGHRFWEHEDPAERAAHQVHFFKNMGLLGGLLIAAADTHGKPSAAWRARQASKSAKRASRSASLSVRDATHTVRDAAATASHTMRDAATTARNTMRETASSAKNAAKAAAAD